MLQTLAISAAVLPQSVPEPMKPTGSEMLCSARYRWNIGKDQENPIRDFCYAEPWLLLKPEEMQPPLPNYGYCGIFRYSLLA